jgi:hypothetical protein
MSQESTGITASDLKEILRQQSEENAKMLRETIAAVKAPTAVEQQQLDAAAKERQDKQDARLQNSTSLLEEIANKKALHETCAHRSGNPVHSHCVWIQEKVGPGYILCQLNQCIIRPGSAPSPNYKGTVVYDHALFNRLFQECNNNNSLFS